MKAGASRADITRWRANLEDELHGAAVYEALAEVESDGPRAGVFRELAAAERRHAAVWTAKLKAQGIRVDLQRRALKTRVMRQLVRALGPNFVLPALAAAEFADRDKYAAQADAQALSAEERGHAAVVQALADGDASRGLAGAEIARREPGHRQASSGNDLRAAVLGANDGLVSNFCLLMGVAGAGSANRAILLTGLAGLIAGACSMALGEWLSVTNARELARTQIAREAEEIEQMPEAERRELALIFQAKGVDADEARRVAGQIMRDKAKALDTLTREELGIDPEELGGNPWSAAGVSFGLFSLGAAFPTVPFLWAQGVPAIAQSVAFSAVGLATVGVVTSMFNGRSAAYSAGRQILIGLLAAAFTYGAGQVLGVSVS